MSAEEWRGVRSVFRSIFPTEPDETTDMRIEMSNLRKPGGSDG